MGQPDAHDGRRKSESAIYKHFRIMFRPDRNGGAARPEPHRKDVSVPAGAVSCVTIREKDLLYYVTLEIDTRKTPTELQLMR